MDTLCIICTVQTQSKLWGFTAQKWGKWCFRSCVTLSWPVIIHCHVFNCVTSTDNKRSHSLVSSHQWMLDSNESWCNKTRHLFDSAVYFLSDHVYNRSQSVKFHCLSREHVQMFEFTLKIRARMHPSTPAPPKCKLDICNLQGPSRFVNKLTTCTTHKKNIQNYYSLKICDVLPTLVSKMCPVLIFRRDTTWLSFHPGKRHLQYCCICLFLIWLFFLWLPSSFTIQAY